MTGKEILERALDLCALHTDDIALRDDLQDMKARALGLLNTLIATVTPINMRLTGKLQDVQELTTLAETVDLLPGICGSLLPFALAAVLVAEEDPELSNAFADAAREARLALMRDGVSTRHRIVEVYGT